MLEFNSTFIGVMDFNIFNSLCVEQREGGLIYVQCRNRSPMNYRGHRFRYISARTIIIIVVKIHFKDCELRRRHKEEVQQHFVLFY